MLIGWDSSAVQEPDGVAEMYIECCTQEPDGVAEMYIALNRTRQPK